MWLASRPTAQPFPRVVLELSVCVLVALAPYPLLVLSVFNFGHFHRYVIVSHGSDWHLLVTSIECHLFMCVDVLTFHAFRLSSACTVINRISSLLPPKGTHWWLGEWINRSSVCRGGIIFSHKKGRNARKHAKSNEPDIKGQYGAWGDGSSVMSTYQSYRGPDFGSSHLVQVAHNHLKLQLRGFWCLWPPRVPAHIYTYPLVDPTTHN